MNEIKPEVGFFLEKHVPQAEHLRKATLDTVLTPKVLAFLRDKEWGVSIAIPGQLTPSVTETIRTLNQRCPHSRVAAWILLPPEEGYWTNALNLPETDRVVKAVVKTAKQEGLRIDEVGIDLEFPHNLTASMRQFVSHPVRFFVELAKIEAKNLKIRGASLIGAKKDQPRERFSELVANWRKQGIGVETYEIPIPPQLLSLLTVLTPDESLEVRRFGMFYSSFFPPQLRKIEKPNFSFYAVDAMQWLARRELHPALGVVSGKEGETAMALGAPEGGEMPCLNQREFSSDVRRLMQKDVLEDHDLYIYALGGKETINLLTWTEEALGQ